VSIRINVDPANPGQFFACCGLLELADRLWDGAEGWFEGREFRVECPGMLEALLACLVMDPPEELTKLDNGLEVKKIIAPLRFSFDGGSSHSLTLDAWTRIGVEKGKAGVSPNRPWNFWSGNQKSFDIWSDLRAALVKQLPFLRGPKAESILSQRVPLGGRFGFDPGAAWNALDVGFSPNTQQMPVASSPATEMLAAVGIQRFRPVFSDDLKSFLYATWGQPLLPSAAAAAASSLVLVMPAKEFRGHVVDRGQYGALAYSTPLKGVSDGRPAHAV
jgi:CRISPR-associated protein Csx14